MTTLGHDNESIFRIVCCKSYPLLGDTLAAVAEGSVSSLVEQDSHPLSRN